MLAIRLPPKIEKSLAVLARKTGQTKTFHAREAILDYLQDWHDYQLAEQRLKTERGKSIPLEEVMKRYGMDPLESISESSPP